MEPSFYKEFVVRWADLDANIHMRHSAYNDYAAQTRLMFMAEKGFTMEWFKQHNIFPILFREETVFLREIHGNEKMKIDALLLKMSSDGSRWSIMNRFYKEDGTLAAKLTVDGAWLDTTIRKLKSPPEAIVNLFNGLEKTEG